MPRSRFAVLVSGVFTATLLAFLWLPVLALYAGDGVLAPRALNAIFFAPPARDLFLNTIFLSTLSAMITVVIGVPVGWAAARGTRSLRAPILLLCALPIALPPTLMASAYLEYSRTPPARSVASLAADHALSINAIFVAAPVLAFCFFPIVAFATWAALENLPADWQDAARLYGDPHNAWTRVLTPLIVPAICGAASIVAALAMWEMGAPDLLDARTYSVQIYRAFAAGGNAGNAARAALPMFLLGALCFYPAWRALRFYERWKIGATHSQRSVPKPNVVITIIALLVLLFSPIAPLAVFLDQARPYDILPQVWQANRDELWNTFFAPALAAILIAFLALTTVLTWREYSPRVKRAVLALSLMPLAAAPILLAVALIEFYNRELFDQLTYSVYGLLVTGYIARFLPLGILWLEEATRRVPPVLGEAAQNLGASQPRIMWTIFVPLLTPPLLAVVAVLFALCAGELSIAVLLNAPGGQTLPVPIFNQMHIGATQSVAALSLTLAAISGGVLLSLLALWAKLSAR